MRERPLSAIAEINPPLPRHVHDSELVSFVRMTDVKEAGGIATATDAFFGSVKLGFTRFAEGDVIFAKITPCMENGKGALATGLTNGIGCGSTEFHVLRAKGENCGGFIYQVVQSRGFRQKAETNMSGSAGQQRVPSDFFKEHTVYIPVPQEQRRIAEILSTLDEAIEQTEALIAKHQQIKAGLMHDLFTRGVTPDGHLRPTREQAPDLYKPSPLGWIPREWEVVRIADAFDIQLGKMLNKLAKTGKLSAPYVGNRAVQWDYVDCSAVEEMDFTSAERQKFILLPNDLLVCEGGDVGRTAMWRGEIENCYYQKAIHRLRPKSFRALPSYMLRFMKFARDAGYFREFTSQSSIAHLTQEKLGSIDMQLPPSDEQYRIADRLDAHDDVLQTEQSKLAKLHQQKHGLMHDLLTGRVRVPVAAATEGASDV